MCIYIYIHAPKCPELLHIHGLPPHRSRASRCVGQLQFLLRFWLHRMLLQVNTGLKPLKGARDTGKGTCWEVSSLGRFRNTRGAVSYGHLRGSGYYEVGIAGQKFQAHRLVAFAFHGPPPSNGSWQVRHKDGNHSNNMWDNLEWTPERVSRSKGLSLLRGAPHPNKP